MSDPQVDRMSVMGRGLPTDGWTQPMMNPRDCVHGSLARKCEICERDHEIHVLTGQLAGAVARIAELEKALDLAASDLRSEGHYEAARRAFAPLETEWGQ
jgi:hypothetical protein